MRPTTMITIDWDYFVPEDTDFDWGHSESPLFYDIIWNIRATDFVAKGLNYREVFKTNGKQLDFWKVLNKAFVIAPNVPVFVTESHKEAYDIADYLDIKQIINFDAHSDLGYIQGWKRSDVDCGNWLGKLMIEEKVKKAFVVYSNETNETPNSFSKITKKYDVEFTDIKKVCKKLDGHKIDVIHICRSGAWTPPWLDGEFSQFVAQFPQSKIINRVKAREWNHEDILKYGEEQRKIIEQLMEGKK